MLRLRPYRECDTKQIVNWIADEKEYYFWSAGHVGAYPLTEEHLKAYWQEILTKEDCFQFSFLKDNRQIGYLNMIYSDPDRTEIRLRFILLDPAYRGRGYGDRMVRMAARYAFNYLGVRRITLGVMLENRAALHCYYGAGFQEIKGAVERSYHFLGRDWYCRDLELYPDTITQDEMAERKETENMKDILESNHFRYAFQPIVDAKTGEIYGYEALMRAGVDGMVSPSKVLQWAEKNHKLYEIERATFFNVMKVLHEIKHKLGDRKIFINSIPGYQLTAEDYEELSEQYADEMKQCVIEITEATEMEDGEYKILRQRGKEHSFGLAVDDYGTGYSNTTNLLKHMPDVVKIDRLLITHINEDSKKQHFVKSMIDFAMQNGIKTLAEGVETVTELRTVIELGIDYIQGYYTARPSFEVMQSVETGIISDIVNANLRGQTSNNRSIYVVDKEKELPLMRIALQQHTGILISQPEFKLVGNVDYAAAMSVKIQDGCDCRLTLQDVSLESFQSLPCIELGENVNLTLILQGENRIRKVGICVPASSSVTICGDGNLLVKVQGIESYGIGQDCGAAVGQIKWIGSGTLDVLVEADDAIGIGGGTHVNGAGIELASGVINISSASARTINLGSVNGSIPINIHDCRMRITMNIEKGIGIGCQNADQNISITNADVEIEGSGSFISGIGSMDRSGGLIRLRKSNLDVRCNGLHVELIGTGGGNVNVEADCSKISLHGEGSEVMGIGSWDKTARIKMEQTECSMSILSGNHLVYGAEEENIVLRNSTQNYNIND